MKPPSKKDISRVMAEMGKRGGKIGGKNRMENLGPNGRSNLTRTAINARWKKYRELQRLHNSAPQMLHALKYVYYMAANFEWGVWAGSEIILRVVHEADPDWIPTEAERHLNWRRILASNSPESAKQQ